MVYSIVSKLAENQIFLKSTNVRLVETNYCFLHNSIVLGGVAAVATVCWAVHPRNYIHNLRQRAKWQGTVLRNFISSPLGGLNASCILLNSILTHNKVRRFYNCIVFVNSFETIHPIRSSCIKWNTAHIHSRFIRVTYLKFYA